jgi:stalled ribosome rescue protein Dom34
MLKSAYLAPDEFTAITLREMLKGKDIPAVIRRFETTWLDGLPKIMKGGWGEVLVDEHDIVDAKKYIEEFLQDIPEP